MTDYLHEHGVRVRYLHSDIGTVERTEIIRDLRLGVFDVLVGINLLREGLDMPEVSLVAIIDADKQGGSSATARASRITHGICRVVWKASHRLVCSITCRTTPFWLLTKAMSRCRSSVACIVVTVHERKRWWNMVSGCPLRWITDRCDSMNSKDFRHRRSTFPLPLVTMRANTPITLSSNVSQDALRNGAGDVACRGGRDKSRAQGSPGIPQKSQKTVGSSKA